MDKFDILAPLDENIIKDLLMTCQNLDFTAKVWSFKKDIKGGFLYKSYDTHTPLTYSIAYNKKDLFTQLIMAGANINHPIDKWMWLPLTYALKNSDSFFLEKLFENKNLDIYQKIDDKNVLNHVMSLSSLNPEECIDNIKTMLMFLKNKSNFEFENFFSTNCFLDNEYEIFHEVLLKELKEEWIEILLNCTTSLENIKPHVAFHLLDIFNDNDVMIKKIVDYLHVNEVLENGNTLLHYYVLNNYKNYDGNKTIKNQQVILALLEKGFHYDVANQQGHTPYEYLKDKEYFNHFIIEKSHATLEKTLLPKENIFLMKI